MPSFSPSPNILLLLALLVLFARPSHAFGAGNIGSTSKVEGQNWRHGDIEDTLLTLLISRAAGGKKFSKLDVKRVYFGNWLRDYSQAVDVGTVKYVSAEAIRVLLWVLGFLTFGYGTKEFEVTSDRLGCYRPEEHIDNPKDYADNEDARQYDRRLRGPVDERRELGINPQTGLKNYIASEGMGIMTSAELIRKLFTKSIELGRSFARSQRNEDLYEALRLLGTACHCMEDYSAHSNYTELALIEIGERNIFPHVGRSTQINLPGARHGVYPIVTGTFGGVDFLHSVCGEFSDKATQSEISQLEGTMSSSQSSNNTSILQNLLKQIPSGLFGGKDQAAKADELQANAQAARMNNVHISPREPEALTRQLNDITKQIYPILQWHDEVMQSITKTIDSIPILPDLIEQVQDQINIFVFGLLAPFVLPIISQIKQELQTGSSEIIKSSQDKQLIVFHDDRATDPTHSMLSKDHFSNILNEPAGKVACAVLRWAVPQVIQCWDDDRADANRVIDRIIHGVFHHPAQRDQGQDGATEGRRAMFQVVEEWWREKSEREKDGLRDQLSRDGVMHGRNHREGVHDTGHGCGKPLGIASVTGGGHKSSGGGGGGNQFGQLASEAVGGGAIGGIVGGLVGGLGAGIGGMFGLGGEEQEVSRPPKKYQEDGRQEYGEHQQTSQYRPPQTHYESHGGPGNYEASSYQEIPGGYKASHTSVQTHTGGGGSSYSKQSYSHAESHGSYNTSYGGGSSGYGQQSSGYTQSGGYSGSSGGYGQQQQQHSGGEAQSYYGGGSSGGALDDYSSRQEVYSGREMGAGTYGEQRTGYGDVSGGYGQHEQRGGYGGGYGEHKKRDDDDDDDDDWQKKREKEERKRREKEEKERHKREEEYGGGGYGGGGYGGGGDQYGSGDYGGGGGYGERRRSGSRERRGSGSRERRGSGSRERRGSRERKHSKERKHGHKKDDLDDDDRRRPGYGYGGGDDRELAW